MVRIGLRTLRWLHVATDTLLVSIGWLGAYALRHQLSEFVGYAINPLDWYVRALPVVVVSWIATCWWFGIYHSPRMRTPVDELQRLLRGAALGLLVLGSLGFFLKEFEFGRTVVVASVGFNLLLQGASRLVFHRLEAGLRRSGSADVPTLIVGTGVAAIRLLQKLQDHPETGYRVVGFLDDCDELPEKEVAGRPVLGNLDDLRAVATEHAVEEIFVALPSLGHTRMLSLVLDCEDLGVTFRVVTNLFEVLTAGTHIDLVDELPLVRLGRERVHPLYDPLKRVCCASPSACGARVWRRSSPTRAEAAPTGASACTSSARCATTSIPTRWRRGSARTRASRAVGRGCATPASTSCPSCGTCCAERCPWSDRGPRCPSSSTHTTSGSAGASR
jgi:FlaA1/EpsC-like NDP-sugar epimerase